MENLMVLPLAWRASAIREMMVFCIILGLTSTEEDIQGIFVSMENGESDYDSGRKQIESDLICFLCVKFHVFFIKFGTAD
jgi:hypothetical protein